MLLKFRNKSKKKLWSSTIALDFPDMTLLCRVLLRQPSSRLSINPSTFTLFSVEKQKCSEIFQRVPLSNFGGAGDGRGPYKAAALGHARPQGARPHVEPPKQRITLPVPVQVKKSPYLTLLVKFNIGKYCSPGCGWIRNSPIGYWLHLLLHRKCTDKFSHWKVVKELCWINNSVIRCRKLSHFVEGY